MSAMKGMAANWKSTVVGLVTAIAAFVEFDPSLFGGKQWIISLSKFIMIGGFAALGLVAKDRNVTGGTVANPTNDPSVVKDTANHTKSA